MDYRRGVAHLKRCDSVMAKVVAKVGPCRFRHDPDGEHFSTLVESIIYQQLQGRAAAAISGRLQSAFGGRFPSYTEVLASPPEVFRASGVSPQKEAAIRDLAGKVAAGAIPLKSLEEMSDDGVIEVLTQVRGIGRWTAQMFLIFHLGRLDVLPTGDYGLLKAVQREYRLRLLPKPERLEKLAKPWSPYRTLATWYLWTASNPVLLGGTPPGSP